MNPIRYKIIWTGITSNSCGLRQSGPTAKILLEWMQTNKERENSDETDEGADHATGRFDNVDWCSPCEGCRIMVSDCRGCLSACVGRNLWICAIHGLRCATVDPYIAQESVDLDCLRDLPVLRTGLLHIYAASPRSPFEFVCIDPLQLITITPNNV